MQEDNIQLNFSWEATTMSLEKAQFWQQVKQL